MILDGKRLSESEWLRMLADEEHASLEEMFYEYHSNAVQSVSLVPAEPAQTAGEIPSKAVAEMDPNREPPQAAVQHESAVHGLDSPMIRLMIPQAS